jgi:pimeloyl-ACP methyl ester carboxylesterase
MQVVQRGTGSPIVLVPSLHGRWEYFGPTIEALSRSFRVISFSLPESAAEIDDPDPERALDRAARVIDRALEAADVGRAAICGVSFGGILAVRFAARRPEATAALVLVSSPAPGWRPAPRHALYARWPRTLGPLFFAESPWRLWSEIAAALPGLRQRRDFLWGQLRTAARAPLSPPAMAARARLIARARLDADCARITAPTLVITGEPALDRVVPVEGTTAYLRLIRGAQLQCLARTGHLGSVTRPEAFHAAVKAFLDERGHAAA